MVWVVAIVAIYSGMTAHSANHAGIHMHNYGSHAVSKFSNMLAIYWEVDSLHKHIVKSHKNARRSPCGNQIISYMHGCGKLFIINV